MSRSIAQSTLRSTLVTLFAIVAAVAARPAAAQRAPGLGWPGRVGHPPIDGPTTRPDRRDDRPPSFDGSDGRAPDVGSATMAASAVVAFAPLMRSILYGESRRQVGTVYYTGTVLGATLGAYVSSRPHDGCVRRSRTSRLARSAAAAVIGAAPALLYLGTGHHGFSSTGFSLGLSTPLSQGIAADLLLRQRCGEPA